MLSNEVSTHLINKQMSREINGSSIRIIALLYHTFSVLDIMETSEPEVGTPLRMQSPVLSWIPWYSSSLASEHDLAESAGNIPLFKVLLYPICPLNPFAYRQY